MFVSIFNFLDKIITDFSWRRLITFITFFVFLGALVFIAESKTNYFALNKLEKETGKEINYTVLTSQEFIYRKKCKDKFLTSILSNCAVIIDHANE